MKYMKWSVSALLLSLSLPCTLQAKGLDKLQPATEQDEDRDNAEQHKKDEKGIVDKASPPLSSEGRAQGDKDKPATPSQKRPETAAKENRPLDSETPVEPGFQDWYLGTSLNYIDTDGPEGDWHSSSTADLELGYRAIKKWLEAYDLYATIRYLPVDVTIELEQRAYRGVLEHFLAGVKAQREWAPSFFAVGSVEAGLAKTSVSAIDGVQKVDGSLEKSSVDLVVGAGVSYSVVDKIALGTQLHFGVGAHKTLQFGLDLRFLL
jgi:hypothetical protein